MPGGLIQLVAIGAQNYLLNGNPSISFFKKIYKTHTNFSMESIKSYFNKNYANFYDKTTLTCKISRNADLIQEIYFSFSIPEIRKILKRDINGENIIGDDFRYVQNLGEAFIHRYFLYIGGSIIDTQYGEWLHIWNELTIDSSKRYGYDKLIGNVPELYIPDRYNRLLNGQKQINKTRLYVPLRFWFNRNPGLALPLIALQYHEIELHIELRPYKEIFTINETAPSRDFNWKTYFNDFDIEPYLEINYIFLDTYERKHFATKSQDYLIEQVIQVPIYKVPKHTINELVLQNPVKEIIWVFKRNDLEQTNNWFEFIDTHYDEETTHEDPDTHECICTHNYVEKEILSSAKFIFNGLDRIEEKEASYYNLIQPYQYHTNVPKAGVYVYSFSLYPEQFQPSGACNMSRINKIELNTNIITNNESYDYDLFVYVVNYNFLRITAGLAGLAFSC